MDAYWFLKTRGSIMLTWVVWMGLSLVVEGVEPSRSVAHLRSIPRSEVSKSAAAKSYPVELDGVVTYLRDTERDFNFSLEDGTGGIMVYPAHRLELKPGQRVRVKGVANVGKPGFNVQKATVNPGEMAGLPEPLTASILDLSSGRFEGRFVEVEASVRRVRMEGLQVLPQRLALDLGPQTRPFTAWITHYQGEEGRFSSGMVVRLRGVCLRWVNSRGQPTSTALLVNGVDDVSVLVSQSRPPVSQLMDVQEWVGSEETAPRMACYGTVTYHREGELTVIQDGTRAIRVRPVQQEAGVAPGGGVGIRPGDQVEVTGFPVMGEYTIELEYADIRKVAAGEPVVVEEMDSVLAMGARGAVEDRDGRLVRLTGAIRGVQERTMETVVEVAFGEKMVLATLPRGAISSGVREGALVRLTGICSLHLNAVERRMGTPPGDFSLLVQDGAAVELLRGAPWWTNRYLGYALGGFVAIATLTAAWAVVVGRKNALLRREIRARIFAEERLDEDRRRVAGDLHDTLQQTLLAADLQLNAALRTIPSKPQAALPLVSLAAQLLSRSRGEVRDAVWDLSIETSELRRLSGLLSQACSEASEPSSLQVSFSVEGEEPELPALLVSQCVRVGREAITNAIKHAQARSVTVVLRYADNHVQVEIRDDGIGFDPSVVPGPETGHFGISGMQERLRRLGGRMDLESGTGQGTLVRVRMPVYFEI